MAVHDPGTDAGRVGLATLLADPERALLAFDYDGTLSPIVPDPDEAVAHPDVPGVLGRLATVVGRIAVITGRPAQVAADRLGLGAVPGSVVLGHYGLERWQDGTVSAPEVADGVGAARARLPRLLEQLGAPEGTWVEDKGHAVAVHLRRAADPQAALDLVRGPVTALAEETGLAMEPGRMVLELRPPGADKGAALRGLVEDLDPSVVTFTGDDLGDLPGFAAVAELREAGRPGLLVCSGSDEVAELRERADLVVDGPDGVVRLFRELADRLGARP